MTEAKKNPVAAAATGVVEGPYTGLGNGQEEVVNSAEMAAIRALDRKLTDGFNLVHGQFAVLRSERQEDREEFRDFRRQHREDCRELKTDIARVDARAEQRTKELEVRLTERLTELDARAEQRTKELEVRFNERLTEVDARAEQRTKELEVRFNEQLTEVDARVEQRTKELEAGIAQRFGAAEARLGRLENALLDLTALANKSLERSSGTRRLAWGVLGAVGLLLAGGLIRPLFERAVAALVGG